MSETMVILLMQDMFLSCFHTHTHVKLAIYYTDSNIHTEFLHALIIRAGLNLVVLIQSL